MSVVHVVSQIEELIEGLSGVAVQVVSFSGEHVSTSHPWCDSFRERASDRALIVSARDGWKIELSPGGHTVFGLVPDPIRVVLECAA